MTPDLSKTIGEVSKHKRYIERCFYDAMREHNRNKEMCDYLNGKIMGYDECIEILIDINDGEIEL